MLTIIGYLLVLLAVLLGTQDIPGQNILLHTGLLVLTAYVCGKLARSLRIPAVIGYIVAGVIIGQNGIELISPGYSERMRFIEQILFMILIAHTVRSALKPRLPEHAGRILIAGALSSLLSFAITLGLVASLTVSYELKIVISLFAATFSPVILYQFTDDDTVSNRVLIMSFGGLVTATILWGVITPFMDPSVTAKVRLASMPVYIALVSTITGVVWGFIAEKALLFNKARIQTIYPVAVMFLIYPLVNGLGLDNIFIAVGVGLFNGLLSDRKLSVIEKSEFPALIVFSFFGMQISLQDMFLLPAQFWSLISILIAVLIFTRFVSTKITVNVIPRTSRLVPFTVLLSLSGPIAMVYIRRFLPGYSSILPADMGLYRVFSVFTSVMLLIALGFGVVTAVLHKTRDT